MALFECMFHSAKLYFLFAFFWILTIAVISGFVCFGLLSEGLCVQLSTLPSLTLIFDICLTHIHPSQVEWHDRFNSDMDEILSHL